MGEAAGRKTVTSNSLRRPVCRCACISVLVQNEASKCKAESSEQTKFARESIRKDAKYVSSPLLALDYLEKKVLL